MERLVLTASLLVTSVRGRPMLSKPTSEVWMGACDDYCNPTFDPVCGENGKQYTNACFALCNNIISFDRGACPEVAIVSNARHGNSSTNNTHETRLANATLRKPTAVDINPGGHAPVLVGALR
eukprot:m.442802 g.442802  ORF g.442802 m.442802 type:complete len:123 (+) comp18861_c0_seq1:153-521(+)